jgi:hypothetical protein
VFCIAKDKSDMVRLGWISLTVKRRANPTWFDWVGFLSVCIAKDKSDVVRLGQISRLLYGEGR